MGEKAEGSQLRFHPKGWLQPAGAPVPASRGCPCGLGRPRGTPISVCAPLAEPHRVVSRSSPAEARALLGHSGSGEVRSPGKGDMDRDSVHRGSRNPHGHTVHASRFRTSGLEGQSRVALALDVSL